MKTKEQIMRERAAYQFELQADKLAYRIVKRLPNYKYILENQLSYNQEQITALVVCESFDYYEYRLHRAKKQRVHLVICQEHNAVLPIECVEMQTGMVYEAGKSPTLNREDRKNRNHKETKLLVSHLLLDTQRGNEELQQMEKRTRQRFLRMKKDYLTPRIGRPIAS